MAGMTADQVRALSDEELCDHYRQWVEGSKLEAATEPLPPTPDISGESIREFELIRAELRERDLEC